MGLFLETAIILDFTAQAAKAAVHTLAEEKGDYHVEPAKCFFHEQQNGVIVIFDHPSGYGSLAKRLSELTERPVLLLFIYDGDYWGYNFYENGTELDYFDPYPDYFDADGKEREMTDEEKAQFSGNSKIISDYFSVEEEQISRYLVCWSWSMYNKSAYEDDESTYWEDWQMADFMKKIGFPFPFSDWNTWLSTTKNL